MPELEGQGLIVLASRLIPSSYLFVAPAQLGGLAVRLDLQVSIGRVTTGVEVVASPAIEV